MKLSHSAWDARPKERGTRQQTFLGGRNGKGDVYAYDQAHRLVDARFDVTNPAAEVTTPGSQPYVKLLQYTLDGLGNRSQVRTTPPTPPTAVTYAADVVNQYTAIGGVTRAHDNNGNLKDDGTHLFGFDFENRLVEVKLKSTSALVATYRYDALGRRVEKVVAAGSTTRYILDGVQVVEEYDGTGAWQARYLYEDGIDRPRCMDRADVADVNGNSNTSEVPRFHYHQQALGSVTEISQPTGAVVEWVTYDAYGAATVRSRLGTTVTSSAVGNPWLFTGREFDAESGLYHYRARAYDPGAGRFLQRDPLGFVYGLGLTEYVESLPATKTDPSGLRSEQSDGVPWDMWPSELARHEEEVRAGLDTARSALQLKRMSLSHNRRKRARLDFEREVVPMGAVDISSGRFEGDVERERLDQELAQVGRLISKLEDDEVMLQERIKRLAELLESVTKRRAYFSSESGRWVASDLPVSTRPPYYFPPPGWVRPLFPGLPWVPGERPAPPQLWSVSASSGGGDICAHDGRQGDTSVDVLGSWSDSSVVVDAVLSAAGARMLSGTAAFISVRGRE